MTEGSFISFFKRKDREEEFEKLYREHAEKIYWLGLRMTGNREDALDVVQETLARVYKGLGGFQKRSSPSTWIYSIAINVCRNFHRKKAANPLPLMMEKNETETPDFVGQIETREIIEKALLALPEDLRTCVLLSDLSGFSYKKISGILRVPVGTVKSRIFRGRKKLIELMKLE